MGNNDITLNMKKLTKDLTNQGNIFLGARYTKTALLEQVTKVERAIGIQGAYEPELKTLRRMIKEAFISAELRESINSIDYLKLDGLKTLINDSNLPVKFDAATLVKTLNDKYTQYPRREAYTKRIVESCADDEFKDENGELTCSVFSAIVKQFIKYDIKDEKKKTDATKKLVCKKFHIEEKNAAKRTRLVLQHTDDFLIDDYKEIKELYGNDDDKREQYYPLYVAYNMSTGGVSRSNQKQITKEELYYFAFAFNMTYYTKDEMNSEKYDVDRDIRKQLFEDYYTASVFDFEADEKQGQENLGDGIDLKNFAEVIYLYYLRKGRDEKAAKDDRVKKAYSMIKACRTYFENMDYSQISEKSDDYYDDTNNYSDIPFYLNEAEFEKYIKGRYADKRFTDSNISIWEKPEQITATQEYVKLISKLQGKDVNEFLDCTVFDGQSDPFTKIVGVVYDYIKEALDDVVENRIDIAGDYVSREKLISLYCLAYLRKYKDDRREKDDRRKIKFERLFKDFCGDKIRGLNKLLEECRYQEFTEKNLFDVIILCIIYINVTK
ncbi:MAG: hypothetical protein J1E81_02475 [Eubacterium sp.]|nr:hypothetical protein [Eubacterium sp.]